MFTDKKIKDERYEICKSCEHLTCVKFCRGCGCFMPVKTWLKDVSCPINKW